jgi:hypothetical protein
MSSKSDETTTPADVLWNGGMAMLTRKPLTLVIVDQEKEIRRNGLRSTRETVRSSGNQIIRKKRNLSKQKSREKEKGTLKERKEWCKRGQGEGSKDWTCGELTGWMEHLSKEPEPEGQLAKERGSRLGS